jgi:hypothetical protein
MTLFILYVLFYVHGYTWEWYVLGGFIWVLHLVTKHPSKITVTKR